MQARDEGEARDLHRRLGTRSMEEEPLTAGEGRSNGDAVRASEDQDHDHDHDHKHKHKKKEKVTRADTAMSLASHALTTGLTVYFTVLGFKSYSLFSWHPACMAIGSLALSAQSIMVMSHGNILTGALTRKWRVRSHWILLVLASAFIAVGFITIVVNKNDRGKRHFVSVHAIVGLLSMLLMVLGNANGVAALYARWFKTHIKPPYLKLGHSIHGIITFVASIAALVTGLFTNFYKREASSSSQVICTIALGLAGVFTLVSSVKSAYRRFKKLSQGHSHEHHTQLETKKIVFRCLSTMSFACHVLTAGLSVYFTYVSFKSYQFFSWHPACMTIGALALMAQAIMVMSPENILASPLGRQGRVRAHWILQALAAGFIFAGFLVVVVNKNRGGKPHFATLHAVAGLVTVVLVALTSCGGVGTLFSARFKALARPAAVKLAHNILGIVTFAAGVITLVLGLYSGFYRQEAGFSSQVICTVILTLAGILTLETPVKSAYARFKSLSQV
ncbi:uncharacterized protein LOC134536485 [Bacillus rossius redtenbacheri]|uniref:uncharacterized protein LOC134536485 n=1 Tax=Bacillus rossius redtenbacheri TaxID=93214 RepID=UPI002FDEEACB